MAGEQLFERTGANRLVAADLLAGLTSEQWQAPSLCDGWTIRDLAGHLLMPLELRVSSFLVAVVRSGGSTERAADRISRRLAQRPVEEIVETLRVKAGTQVTPPGVGAFGPFTDSCVHLRDAARPLQLDVSVPLPDWRTALDFLVTRRARLGFVPSGRLAGLRLEADDQDWAWGDGSLVRGHSEALAMSVCGRPAALAELSGAGVGVLRTRLV